LPVLAKIGSCLPCPPVATKHIVENTGDSGEGSLRQCIKEACAGDTIAFSASISGDTIMVMGAEIAIGKNLIILGPGKNLLVINGNGNSRLFNIGADTELTLSGLTLTNGFSLTDGGAILNDGVLRLRDISLKDNFEGVNRKGLTNTAELVIDEGTVELNQ
jgi:hypothetical protein